MQPSDDLLDQIHLSDIADTVRETVRLWERVGGNADHVGWQPSNVFDEVVHSPDFSQLRSDDPSISQEYVQRLVAYLPDGYEDDLSASLMTANLARIGTEQTDANRILSDVASPTTSIPGGYNEEVASHVMLYTSPGCSRCHMTEKRLKELDVHYEKVDLSTSPEALDHVRSLGFKEAPVVELPNGEAWSGFRDANIRDIPAEYHISPVVSTSAIDAATSIESGLPATATLVASGGTTLVGVGVDMPDVTSQTEAYADPGWDTGSADSETSYEPGPGYGPSADLDIGASVGGADM